MPSVPSLPGLGDDYITQFFPGDIVTYKSDAEQRALIVVRTWADEDDEDLEPDTDPLNRNLLRGEVGLRHLGSPKREIVPENDLMLWTRTLQPGDIVKRTLASIEAAVVLSTTTELQVEQAFTCEPCNTWIPSDKVTCASKFREGDRVVCGNWIGMITMVVNVGRLYNQRSGLGYDLYDTLGTMWVGSKPNEIFDLMAERGLCRTHLEVPPWGDGDADRVAAVETLQIEVFWMALNQKIPARDQHRYPQPKALFNPHDMRNLTYLGKELDKYHLVGTTYVFKDQQDHIHYGIEPTKHGEAIGELVAFRVRRTRTKARLQWQDGTITEDWSTAVVPHDNVDEHEAWPGQHIFWKDDDGGKRAAVVQSFDPNQRLVDILLTDTSTKETVSVLEIDINDEQSTEYGVNPGQLVFLCENNGSPIPHVPAIGRVPESMTDAVLRLKVLSDIPPPPFETADPRLPPNNVDWFGEVISLELDGRIRVLQSNGVTITVGLQNVLRLRLLNEDEMMDLMDQQDDKDATMTETPPRVNPIDAFFSAMQARFPGIHFADVDPPGQTNGDEDEASSEDSWETTSSIDDEDMEVEESNSISFENTASGEPEGLATATDMRDDPMNTETASDDIDRVDASIEVAPSSPATHMSRSPPPTTFDESSSQAGPSPKPRDVQWESFDILETAPADHRYYAEAPAASSRVRMKKVNAEHKALRSSLPDNILVRTYEDRLDLMRVLIIGPRGTPYAGAPFVFDIFLHANYPFEPPAVHFHSHTNGKGRCNPNLYEEGKVCLSILGTWSGDATESWDPERSSLLQVFVSISGLVLVRNPYHCEPAYAKLEGTKEGRINSRLYSEKAYVLSKGFVKQALAYPPAGLENELKHYYLTTRHLGDVIDHARRLMSKEADLQDGDEGGARWNDDVIGSLTAGAKLSLKRVLGSLERSWEDYQAAASS